MKNETIRIQQLKNILNKFFAEKKVKPPITGTKLKQAGYNKTEFLLELSKRLGSFKDMPIIQNYLKACERLL